jgi:pimeloyl-ACP methyl ester carboxylesterase
MSEELKRDIPVSRVRVVPRTGHWLPVEDPDGLASAILEFLS